MKDLSIRKYKPSDCGDLAKLFHDTIYAVNSKDYTEEQLNAWASGSEDLEKWNGSLAKNTAFVAIINDIIVGFGDIDKTGYLDRLFVHKDHQRENRLSPLRKAGTDSTGRSHYCSCIYYRRKSHASIRNIDRRRRQRSGGDRHRLVLPPVLIIVGFLIGFSYLISGRMKKYGVRQLAEDI